MTLVIGLCSLTSYGAEQTDSVKVQWFGQSAIKITTPDGENILIDPYLTANPKTPEPYKNLKNLGKIDLILVTHGHFDHLGDTADLLTLCHCKLVAPSGLEDNLVNTGDVDRSQLIHMNKSGSINPFPDVTITMVHAEHSSEYDWYDSKKGTHQVLYGGEPVGFIINIRQRFTIYHMGDTGLFGDMSFIGNYYHPDLILIPIGGNFTMGPQEAAFATSHWLNPKYALPIHYGTYPILKGTPMEYEKSLTQHTTEVIHLQPGETRTFNF
ncbi:MAG: metal-dependent hydrolase [Ferrovum sp. 37-45-19]|nr:MAG: metal-dependent hydrolase [Ferrovum sp. 21-44-67]OYV93370.1 MAG: metal-dependent hydrolase [Ferrovum sp. 37-45-19]OZB32128.1 MAG: metal-dependent hydrolase [Ferrovum sp. 34-44-207]